MLRSKEIFMAEREASNYCTKCRTNWSALRGTEIDDNFETHHVCPKCETNLWLTDAKEGEILTPYKLGQPVANILDQVQLPSFVRNKQPYNNEAYKSQFEAREKHQDERMEQYRKDCKVMSKDEAFEIYKANPLLAHYDIEVN